MVREVVSGGQTGVERAGLDAAIKASITIDGYPAGLFDLEYFGIIQ